MKNALQARVTSSEIGQADAEASTRELEILEQAATLDGAIKVGTAQVTLNPSPICADWILEGNPVASNKLLSSSADGTASTLIWACTAGRFNWYYDIDETVYVLEGSVVIQDSAGTRRRIKAGDTVFFPKGSSAEWTVEGYVRKIAFCRVPLSRKMLLATRVYQALMRLVGRGGGSGDAQQSLTLGSR